MNWYDFAVEAVPILILSSPNKIKSLDASSVEMVSRLLEYMEKLKDGEDCRLNMWACMSLVCKVPSRVVRRADWKEGMRAGEMFDLDLLEESFYSLPFCDDHASAFCSLMTSSRRLGKYEKESIALAASVLFKQDFGVC